MWDRQGGMGGSGRRRGLNLVSLGGFVLRAVPRAAPHSGRGLSPLTAEKVRLREKWWLFWGHSACKRQSQGSNSDSRACVCTHCSVLPSQGIAS